jgi:hypothetical protein
MSAEGEQFTIRVDGSLFSCECGCNVFHKNGHDPDEFTCNGCGRIYMSEPLTKRKTKESSEM